MKLKLSNLKDSVYEIFVGDNIEDIVSYMYSNIWGLEFEIAYNFLLNYKEQMEEIEDLENRIYKLQDILDDEENERYVYGYASRLFAKDRIKYEEIEEVFEKIDELENKISLLYIEYDVNDILEMLRADLPEGFELELLNDGGGI